MPRPKTHRIDVKALVREFARRLEVLVAENATMRAREAVLSALGPARRGRLSVRSSLHNVAGRPKQLCPVPGCPNPAAPAFGMVCANHKDVPKAQVTKFREERRAKKILGKG